MEYCAKTINLSQNIKKFIYFVVNLNGLENLTENKLIRFDFSMCAKVIFTSTTYSNKNRRLVC